MSFNYEGSLIFKANIKVIIEANIEVAIKMTNLRLKSNHFIRRR